MMKILLLCLILLQTSFAMDSSIEEALRCIEKKKMDVYSIENINDKIYVTGWFIRTDDDPCRYKTEYASSVFEYKKNCVFQEKNWLKKEEDVRRKGLFGTILNSRQNTIIVTERDSVLWSCSLETRDLSEIQVLDKNKLMVGYKDSIGILDNKCQWTLFEQDARMPLIYKATSNSHFLHYYLKQDKPYIVFFDSLYNKHWGTSSSFYIYVSTRTIACGYDDDGADSSKALIKCIEWTGNHFVEKTLPHKVDIPDSEDCLCACSWTERLFPCGDGICVQNYETKKIEILVDK